jgi:membrane-associated protein
VDDGAWERLLAVVVPMIAFLGGLDPELLIQRGGLVLLAAIVFAESGLLFGFFLPGDSLLFAAGAATATMAGELPSIWAVLVVVIVAAVAGDQVGYLFGQRAGKTLAHRHPSRFFRPEHLRRSEAFVARHGPRAVVLARFVPIVRTFAPIVAGIGVMRYRTFVTFNILGGVLWGGGITMLGHLVGGIGVIRDNLELAIVVIVAVSLMPVAVEAWRHRRMPAEPPVEQSPLGATDEGSGSPLL